MSTPPILTVLTDFGTTDYYVAAVKGVLLRLAPAATVVDVSHDLPPGDVEAASFLLAAASRWHPLGAVHLAVVDPGVGSQRRILAALAGGSYFVAPDNGLLSGVLAENEDAEVRAVDREDLYLPGPGSTFHGRDRFAPVAAHLAAGGDFSALGPVVDDPVLLPHDPPSAEGTPPRADLPGSVLRGRVAHVDRFGNLVTDLPSDWLGDAEVTVEVAGDHGGVTTVRADHFAEIPEGRAAVLPGSLGTLELAVDGRSLAAAWGVRRGDAVSVRFGPSAGEDTPVGEGGKDRESQDPESHDFVRAAVAPSRAAAPSPSEPDGAPERERARPQPGGTGMTQWEYKVINIRSENYRLDPDCDEELNDYGADGWELVGLTSVNFKSGATDNIAMVFKRPYYDD